MAKTSYRFNGRRDGDGTPLEYYSGIPARDLTADDYADLTPELKDLVKASKLYTSTDKAAPATESGPTT